MKKHFVKLAAILFVLSIFTAACSLKAQSNAVSPAAAQSGSERPANAIVGTDGNYKAVSKATADKGTDTGKTFTDSKGTAYPVFKSAGGKLYYIRTSKQTGNDYKVYLTL